MKSTNLELRALANLAETIVAPARTTRDQQRARLARRTRKPHIYREAGYWLALEHTAPGEWWLEPFEWPS